MQQGAVIGLVLLVLLGGLLLGIGLERFFKRRHKRKERQLSLEEFKLACEFGEGDQLFIFMAQERPQGSLPQTRFDAAYANEHNWGVIQRRLSGKLVDGLTLEPHQPGNPFHKAAILVAIETETRFISRDNRIDKGRRRSAVELDNAIGPLRGALGAEASKGMAEALLKRYSMMYQPEPEPKRAAAVPLEALAQPAATANAIEVAPPPPRPMIIPGQPVEQVDGSCQLQELTPELQVAATDAMAAAKARGAAGGEVLPAISPPPAARTFEKTEMGLAPPPKVVPNGTKPEGGT